MIIIIILTLIDMSSPSQTLSPPPLDSADRSQKLLRIRHTCAHVLAMAVQTLFPETKVAIGPCTENGFYYDFDRASGSENSRSLPFTPDDLEQIAAEMRRSIRANLPIIREVVEREEIQAEITALKEPYKQEILAGIAPEETITRYFIGSPDVGRGKLSETDSSLLDFRPVPPSQSWWDLCAGPHVQSTGEVHPKAFTLESVAGAYWRGDEKRQQMTRIYGVTFQKQKELIVSAF